MYLNSFIILFVYSFYAKRKWKKKGLCLTRWGIKIGLICFSLVVLRTFWFSFFYLTKCYFIKNKSDKLLLHLVSLLNVCFCSYESHAGINRLYTMSTTVRAAAQLSSVVLRLVSRCCQVQLCLVVCHFLLRNVQYKRKSCHL